MDVGFKISAKIFGYKLIIRVEKFIAIFVIEYPLPTNVFPKILP